MHRYFVTGTDTDVGKTRVTAALAVALRRVTPNGARAASAAEGPPTIVKLIQTGIPAGEAGDAARAGKLACCTSVELARFRAPADPWSAALAEGQLPLRGASLANALETLAEPIVVEGAGGAAVPINEAETLAHVAKLARLQAILVIGLRLGCINHARLTIAHLEHMEIPLAGAILCERFGPTAESYRRDVTRAIESTAKIFGVMPFVEDEPASVASGARLFASLVKGAA